jgi:hypothetical protein
MLVVFLGMLFRNGDRLDAHFLIVIPAVSSRDEIFSAR